MKKAAKIENAKNMTTISIIENHKSVGDARLRVHLPTI